MTKAEQTAAMHEDHMQLQLSRLKHRLEKIHEGGGEKRIAKQHAKGKLTARERINQLIDEGSEFLEFGAFAGYDMYKEYGGCPAGGVVTGYGRIHDRLCVIVANDATVKAGAWFPITGKKNLRAQEIAMENQVPIIYLVDSAGVFLPMQDEIFPGKEHFGRIFRNNARMSAMGVPQIAAVMGSCVAGGAYLPIMSDESLIVEGTGSIFLAGPYLVRAAIEMLYLQERRDVKFKMGMHTGAVIAGAWSCLSNFGGNHRTIVDPSARHRRLASAMCRGSCAILWPFRGEETELREILEILTKQLQETRTHVESWEILQKS